MSIQSLDNVDIWIWDLVRKSLTRLTFDAAATAPTFSAGTPKMLFQGTHVNSVLWYDDWDHATWDISPDGQRFLMMKETGLAASGVVRPRKINVVLNWFEELKRLVPTGKK